VAIAISAVVNLNFYVPIHTLAPLIGVELNELNTLIIYSRGKQYNVAKHICPL
jgi:hypothetical protein